MGINVPDILCQWQIFLFFSLFAPPYLRLEQHIPEDVFLLKNTLFLR